MEGPSEIDYTQHKKQAAGNYRIGYVAGSGGGLARHMAGLDRCDAHAKDGILLSLGLMAVAIVISFIAFLSLIQTAIMNPAKHLVEDFLGNIQGQFQKADPLYH